MNPAHEHDFDIRARQAHAAALAQVSPQALARLRAARRQVPAPSRRAWPWLAATAFSGVLAVMIGLQWLPSDSPPPQGEEPAIAAGAPDATLPANTLLDENPDLYLWLASSDAPPLAME